MRTGIILMDILPATMSRSDWRGENRIASAPKRDMSVRAAKTAMNSMPQQAVPKGMGQSEFFLPQFTALSIVVVNIFDLISSLIKDMTLFYPN